MANLFGIITFVALLLSAVVAYKNDLAYKEEISATQERKAELAKSRTRLQIASDNLESTIVKHTESKAEVERLAAAEEKQTKVNADLTADKGTKTTKTAESKAKLDEIREKTAKVGDLKELASKMRTTNAELEELNQSITTGEAKLANLTASNNQVESQIGAAKKKLEIIGSGQSLPTLNTRIRSIYPTWGFVTLAAGNNSGVVGNSQLDVMRDGAPIAKLQVTAVESNSSSASIVPDSVAKDVTLMVGDRVVPSQRIDTPARN
ncbi:MAG: hypothetical protein H8M99_09610 [Gloeobacteraceae cyanobacterium ES-bin-144]|nr:hypothetical protein [Verrucomicrobiales bacterium]